MKIFFDHQTFSLQNYGGISRYHAELIDGINKTVDNSAYVSLLFSNNEYLSSYGIHTTPLLPNVTMRGKGKFIYYANQFYSAIELRRKPYDIFHTTYYDTYFTSYLKGKPFVVTFHDMIYEKFHGQFEELAKDSDIIKNKRLLAKQASSIIAVSECTKKDIVTLMDIDPDKIHVIYHGSSLPVVQQIIPNSNRSYLLYVGKRHMYKNFLGFLNATHALLKRYNLVLMCAGGGAFTPVEEEVIATLGVCDLVKQQSITDQTLPILYQNAFAFVFPTLYEGFGIPVLEAFACGCPCIVSNVSSLPEVAGEAALYIDPSYPGSIPPVIERLLDDPDLRESLVQKGYKQLEMFSWQRAVNQTLELYQSIA